MFKVKQFMQARIPDDELEALQEELKNDFRALYIKSKKDDQKIKNYQDLFEQVKIEYEKKLKEIEELKKITDYLKKEKEELLKQKQEAKPALNFRQNFNENDLYNQNRNDDIDYIIRKKRKKQPKVIYEYDSSSENESDLDTKVVEKKIRKLEKKNGKKGISKSIKT